MHSGLLVNEHMFAFHKLCLHYLKTAFGTKELKSANALMSYCLVRNMPRHAKRGRCMMLLQFHNVSIGLPLVLIVLEAFHEKQWHKSYCFYLLSQFKQFILLMFLLLSKFVLIKTLSPKSQVIVSHSTNKFLMSYHSTNKFSSSNFSL